MSGFRTFANTIVDADSGFHLEVNPVSIHPSPIHHPFIIYQITVKNLGTMVTCSLLFNFLPVFLFSEKKDIPILFFSFSLF